jgi:hypothetical protein
MWMLSFVPDAILVHVVNAILILGAVAVFFSYFVINRVLRWFPPVAPYITLLQILSAVILLAGVYFKGSYQTEADWRARVAEAEARVAKAESESRMANDKLSKKSQEKVKVIKGKEIVVKQYIDREVTKYDATCPVPAPVVKAMNAAATGGDIK